MFIRDLVRRLATVMPERTAYVDPARSVSWGGVHERSDRLAAALRQLGLAKGDRTAIVSYETVEAMEHWIACAKSGIARVGINWRYAQREMEHILDDADPAAVLVSGDCVEHLGRATIERLIAGGRHVIGFGADHGLPLDLETLIAAAGAFEPEPLSGSDVLAVSYTSGSTGMPKGVLLTNEGAAWQLASAPFAGGLTGEDVVLNNLPMPGFPIYLSSYAMSRGATTVLPRLFDAKATHQLAREHGVTVMIAVPTMLPAIIDAAAGRLDAFDRLRAVITLGSPSTAGIVARAREAFGCELQNWYGSSETNGAICMLRDADRARFGDRDLSGSVGRPLLHVDFAILDDDANELPRGEAGEIAARGPLLAGYRNNPEETRRALGDGWVRTGDIGFQDDAGFVFLQDRKSFMIISGGFNVYPAVVETVLSQHPGVHEVAVVGAEHPRWVEAVVAVVVKAPGSEVTAAELIEFCEPRVGRWEVPKHVEFVDALPMAASGKLDKRALRAQVAADADRLPWAVAAASR
ncbi:AMP-binding protein [Conexibacter sp. JD483]|uniref:class I adenylate-forming enzyme family protein n=1 Tax=unclassified Conexibacter TaxID=2627773 RepID=UPI00271A8C21|nr:MULTISPECIES: AMP-binding protein [unclassified Conexibacter]MDO8187735.1 AMP-binding protein [Conexibacter sp. CPCC 205706]MDO8200238.1 AMP-binding protein [Conexibacter sp. CPCC 205762]MDR9369414.1 AMP-binding protein [Conexibacter sp. JD483]